MTIEATLERIAVALEAIAKGGGTIAKTTPAATTKAADTKTAPPAETKKAEPPKLNKDGECEQYANVVKPKFLALVKSHGREFAAAVLAKNGLAPPEGMKAIKAGEKTDGQYATLTAAFDTAAAEPSPTAALA